MSPVKLTGGGTPQTDEDLGIEDIVSEHRDYFEAISTTITITVEPKLCWPLNRLLRKRVTGRYGEEFEVGQQHGYVAIGSGGGGAEKSRLLRFKNSPHLTFDTNGRAVGVHREYEVVNVEVETYV